MQRRVRETLQTSALRRRGGLFSLAREPVSEFAREGESRRVLSISRGVRCPALAIFKRKARAPGGGGGFDAECAHCGLRLPPRLVRARHLLVLAGATARAQNCNVQKCLCVGPRVCANEPGGRGKPWGGAVSKPPWCSRRLLVFRMSMLRHLLRMRLQRAESPWASGLRMANIHTPAQG
jgi:hypothetical protein